MVEEIREHGVEDGAAGGKDEAMRADLRRRAVVRSDHKDDVGESSAVEHRDLALDDCRLETRPRVHRHRPGSAVAENVQRTLVGGHVSQ